MNTATDTVLIIGGAGMLGSAFAQSRIAQGRRVVVADRRQPNFSGCEWLTLDITDSDALKSVMSSVGASVIINAVNIATLFSQMEQGYERAVRFYAGLYSALEAARKPLHYMQVGTTGSGGLGFTIPFTHGGPIEDMPIIHKAALAGLGSQLLFLIQRSFDSEVVRVSEIKPGLAIFNPKIQTINFNGQQVTMVDGGESGAYTYDELRLLTKYMGYTTQERIIHKMWAVLNQEVASVDCVKHDIIRALEQSIVSQDAEDEIAKNQLTDSMLQERSTTDIPITGNLGPPTVARDLLLATALLRGEWLDGQTVQGTIAYLRETKPSLASWMSELDLHMRLEELRTFQVESGEPWELVVSLLDLRQNKVEE